VGLVQYAYTHMMIDDKKPRGDMNKQQTKRRFDNDYDFVDRARPNAQHDDENNHGHEHERNHKELAPTREGYDCGRSCYGTRDNNE